MSKQSVMSLLDQFYTHLHFLDVALVSLGLFFCCCVRAKLKNDGPMLWPIFGITLEFFLQTKDVYGWITRSLKKSGGTFRYYGVWGGGSYGAVTCLPSNIEYMLKTNFKNYPKGKFYRERFHDLLEDGIFNADDESWKEQRRITITEMHSTRFVDHSFRTTQDLIEKKLLKVMDSLAKSQEPFDLQDMLLRLTFDNICIAGLGDDPGSLAIDLPIVPFAKAFEEATESTLFRVMIPPFMWKPMRFFDIGYEKGLRKAVKTVHEFVDKIVQDRIIKLNKDGTLDHQSDFLSRIIQIESQQKSEKNNCSTIKFFRQFCTSFILAGRDTSSVALTWFFWVIQQHPEVENKIINEIKEILRRRGENLVTKETENITFTVKELNEMVYLQATLSEALRIYPPIPMEMKEALEDDVFPDGTFIRKGSRIYFSIYAMGRMESIWGKDCELFKPERWIQGGHFISDDPYKFVVFNAGPRLCLGRTFAYLQMKMVAASILWRYSMKLVPGHLVFPRVTTTLYMKNGLKVTVKPRLHDEI